MLKKIFLAAAVFCLAFASPVSAVAAQEDVDKVNEMIGSLPEQEDIKEENADAVKEAMDLYDSLTTAEKIGVDGAEKLQREYEILVDMGLIRDEKKEREAELERLKKEQRDVKNGDGESEDIKYGFEITENEPSISVVVRFMTDLNGDGYADPPTSIVLTSPTGDMKTITSLHTSMKNIIST